MTIKVLHLIDSGGLYGAEMMLLNLVEEQVKAGLDPLILSAGTPDIKEKAIETEARKRGLPVKAIRMRAGINIVKAIQIIVFAKKEEFDILHSHGYKFNILIGMFPGFVRKVPLVTTLHGYTSANGFSLIRFYQVLERSLLRFFDGIIYVSDEIKRNSFLKGIRVKKEVTIFNGIDALRIIDAASNDKSVSIKELFPDEHDKCIYVGAIGRLSQEKGFDLLIDAFSDLATRDPRLRLVIVGGGPLRSQLESKLNAMALQDKIKLPGFISPVYRIMKDLDGIVMPSYTEGLPITLLEACILRLRIVASRVGSIADVLQGYKSSIIVAPGDIKELKIAISEQIIDGNDEKVDVGSWNAEKFSSETMAKKYTNFYDQLLSR